MSENTPNSARQGAPDGPQHPSRYLYTPQGENGPQNPSLRGEDAQLRERIAALAENTEKLADHYEAMYAKDRVLIANFRRIARSLREALAGVEQ